MYRLRSVNSIVASLTEQTLEVGMELYFSGFEMGKLTVLRKERNKVIIKEAGHTAWSGRGETSYYPPRLYVGYVIDDKFYCVHEREYTRSTRKQTIEEAIKMMNDISPHVSEDEIEDFDVYLPETSLSRM